MPKPISNHHSRGFEHRLKRELEAQGASFLFEPFYVPYLKESRYLPDIVLSNGIIVEAKGWFKSADRRKHRLIKQQYPALDIRFVFSNPHSRISKQSQTTYAQWCEHHGFQYADKHIPAAWLNEPAKALPQDFKKRGTKL